MENNKTIQSIDEDIAKKRSNAKIYGRVVWYGGLLLLICAAMFFLVMFVRLMTISQKAGELATLRATRAYYDSQTYD